MRGGGRQGQTRAPPGAAREVRADFGAPRDTVDLPPPEIVMKEFLVEGMSCGHCINAVTQAIHSLDPAADVNVDLGSKHVRVHSDIDRFLLQQALVDAGYDPVPVGLEGPGSSDSV